MVRHGDLAFAAPTLLTANCQSTFHRELTRPPAPCDEALRRVVSAVAPVDRLRFGHSASSSGRLQDAERYRGSTQVLPTPRCRGNMLAHARSAAQEVSQLVVAAAISPR